MAASLRGQLLTLAGVLGGLALVAALGLSSITTRMGEDTRRLWQALESVRATEELEIALLQYGREQRRREESGDASQEALRPVEAELQRWLGEAGRHAEDPEEVALLEEVRTSIRGLDAPAPPRGEAAHQLEARLGSVLERVERLVAHNVQDAHRALQRTEARDARANTLALGVVLLMALGSAAAIWRLRRQVFDPLRAVRRALVDFRLGEAWRPAPERGAVEIGDIARAYNAMAARVAQQQEQQLAFLAGIAHDLRNPLNALRMAAVLPRTPGGEAPAPERVTARLALVERQVGRLGRMVEDLLDTTRIEAGRLELQRAPADLVALVRESVDLHRDVSREHPLEVEAPGEALVLVCDATRITQVLNNLLSNAIKYSPGGGTVRVAVMARGPELRVEVRDQGLGVPPEEQASIFEPFRRGSATRTTIPGVGLGLSVARRIAEGHGGRLELESTLGQGSTFTLVLPRGPAQDEP